MNAAPPQAPPSVWLAHCDGSAWPNPGRMGLGVVLTAPDGHTHTLSRVAAHTGCNNEAELLAVLAALQLAHAHGARVLRVHSDNSIVVAQMASEAPPPVVRLGPLFEQARASLHRFEAVQWLWVPRHRNGLADALARAALGLAPKLVRRR